jgi:hypothetical protein
LTPQLYVLVLAVGAGALAVWTDVRFPTLAPGSMGGVLFHSFAAMVALKLVASSIVGLTSGPFAMAVAAVMGIALPGLVYAFITGIWAIRMFQGAYAGSR